MNIEESENKIRNEHPEFSTLRAYFSLFETYPDCNINYVLDYYVEHIYSRSEIHEVLAAIKTIQQNYLHDMNTLNLICLDLTFNYYFLADFETGAELLNYIQKYLLEKIEKLESKK